jgi:hypothetical protein
MGIPKLKLIRLKVLKNGSLNNTSAVMLTATKAISFERDTFSRYKIVIDYLNY